MKTRITFVLVGLIALALPALAQKTIEAREIIAKINRKEAVTYQNATIVGELDLTSLANRKEIRKDEWSSRQFLSVVDVPLLFKNCTFKNKVLAYRSENEDKSPLKNNSVVYNTDFTEAVTFEHCTFNDDAAFKYSRFSQHSVFTDNEFREVALFKYTKFQDAVDFSGSEFRNHADFKYTNFQERSAFQGATFKRYADFKYTKFNEGVDFQRASFSGNADFKYTNFPRGSRFDDTRFSGFADFKYTKLDGHKFSPNRQ